MADEPDGIPNRTQLLAALEATGTALADVIDRIAEPLSETPDDGGWTVRQLLSHLAGAFVRMPVHAAFVTHGDGTIPVLVNDPYWMPEWETAPLAAFSASIRAGVRGCEGFLKTVDEASFAKLAQTPFGPMPLGVFLMISVSGHPQGFHIGQLEAFAG